jgi:hypothetical protein
VKASLADDKGDVKKPQYFPSASVLRTHLRCH